MRINTGYESKEIFQIIQQTSYTNSRLENVWCINIYVYNNHSPLHNRRSAYLKISSILHNLHSAMDSYMIVKFPVKPIGIPLPFSTNFVIKHPYNQFSRV